MMTFEHYVFEVNNPPEHQRMGQRAFQLLEEINPDLANRVRYATNLDPYYIPDSDRFGEKFNEFMTFVALNWVGDLT